jgi:hypothetical protein
MQLQRKHLSKKTKGATQKMKLEIEFLTNSNICPVQRADFQRIVDIPLGTNGAPLHGDLFLYSYEADLLKTK